MKYAVRLLLLVSLILLFQSSFPQRNAFVTIKDRHFVIGDQPYYYIGTNYWYGGLLVSGPSPKRGLARMKKELDFLVANGVNNLRIMAGAEGEGPMNGVERVGPSLQTQPGRFDTSILRGLDMLLAEMGKRKMKAVIFLSNNWEWSGGFLQYLYWNKQVPDSVLTNSMSWDDMRDHISKFYTCSECIGQYHQQVKLVIGRTNTITGKKYTDDPAIMSWEIANEPRPMRSFAIDAYKSFIRQTASLIRSLDKNHLITTGSEGDIGSELMDVYTVVHSDPNINYSTIHIWPKNWGWYNDTSISKGMNNVRLNTIDYISRHEMESQKLSKPLVIEEFGMPRNLQSYSLNSSVSLRNKYYQLIFDHFKISRTNDGVIAGINFWAFGGSGRPRHIYWKEGDDRTGDPPMEQQGLNSVFDSDLSTWKLVKRYTSELMKK